MDYFNELQDRISHYMGKVTEVPASIYGDILNAPSTATEIKLMNDIGIKRLDQTKNKSKEHLLKYINALVDARDQDLLDKAQKLKEWQKKRDEFISEGEMKIK